MAIKKSAIQIILEESGKYINKHPSFEYMPIFTDWSELNPNIQFPCISMLERKGFSQITYCNNALEFQKNIGIFIHTNTKDKETIKNELRTYKEELILHIFKGSKNDDITETIDTTWEFVGDDYDTLFSGTEEDKTFISNVAIIDFKVTYRILME